MVLEVWILDIDFKLTKLRTRLRIQFLNFRCKLTPLPLRHSDCDGLEAAELLLLRRGPRLGSWAQRPGCCESGLEGGVRERECRAACCSTGDMRACTPGSCRDSDAELPRRAVSTG